MPPLLSIEVTSLWESKTRNPSHLNRAISCSLWNCHSRQHSRAGTSFSAHSILGNLLNKKPSNTITKYVYIISALKKNSNSVLLFLTWKKKNNNKKKSMIWRLYSPQKYWVIETSLFILYAIQLSNFSLWLKTLFFLQKGKKGREHLPK